MTAEYTAYETTENEDGDVVILRVFHRRGNNLRWTHPYGEPAIDPKCSCREQHGVSTLLKNLQGHQS